MDWKKGGRDDYVRFVDSPECFLLNVPTKEYIPCEEDVGIHTLVVAAVV